jgi:KUP system potassium uptake protein
VGILYADLGTSPLYVYANTFKYGVHHEDDVLGVLSIIIYSFVLFTMIKIVFIALYANDDGDGTYVRATDGARRPPSFDITLHRHQQRL